MLDLVNVKTEIEKNIFDTNLFICISKHKTSDFLFDQYLHVYASKNNFEIQIVEDINSIYNDMFTIINNNIIYVYKCEKVDYIPDIKDKRLWIRCSSISRNIKNEFNDSLLDLIKLEDWQIKDYIINKYKVDLNQANELIKIYKDLYKLDIESNKLLNNKFDDIKDQLFYERENVIFDLVNSLVRRDKESLKKLNTNVEVFGFLALLIKNFKQVIDIQLAKNSTADYLGVSGKQFWAIKTYSCGKYSREELLNIYKFLTEIDLKIKTGKLDTSIAVDYIISKFIFFM